MLFCFFLSVLYRVLRVKAQSLLFCPTENTAPEWPGMPLQLNVFNFVTSRHHYINMSHISRINQKLKLNGNVVRTEGSGMCELTNQRRLGIGGGP